VFAGSGCGCLNSPSLPYTFGWQLGDVQEGKLLGSYVAGHLAGEKIGVLYENDRFGRDELAGLMAERIRVSARVACAADGRGVGSCARALQASGARAVVALASPAVTQALGPAMAGLGYHPQLVVSGAGDARMSGVITDGFLPSPAASRGSPGASWITLFRRVHDRYIPHVPFDAAVVTGMSAAYEFTAAMFRTGPDPTRGKLLGAMSGLAQGPAVAPLVYSTGDQLGITGGYVGVMRAGVLFPLTTVLSTDDNIAGPVAADRAVQAAAPATGIPAH
jgi:branched-chain amino acid transport system substrate-binding protein